MPPPKPVPNVAPNRLRKRFGLPASREQAVHASGRKPAIASPKANRSPSLLMKTGTPKAVLEHRPERDAAPERGQVAEVADDAARVVGRAREGEADGRRRGRRLRPSPSRSPRRSCAGRPARSSPFDGSSTGSTTSRSACTAENDEVRAAGVERQDDARVLRVAHLTPPSPRAAPRRAARARAGRRTHASGTRKAAVQPSVSLSRPISGGSTAPPKIAMHIRPDSSAPRSGRASTVSENSTGQMFAKPRPATARRRRPPAPAGRRARPGCRARRARR